MCLVKKFLKTTPSIDMSIALAEIVPKIIFNNVDFPQPFLPKTPIISPVFKEKEALFKTFCFPNCFDALCNLNIAKYKAYKNYEY